MKPPTISPKRSGKKNSSSTVIAVVAAVLLVISFLLARDLYLRSQRAVTCSGVSHPTVDMRDFTTRYWTYSGKLEVSVAGKAKVSTDLDPKLLAQISESVQEANEFRKYVVAGYNSCAITATQYAQLEPRFKALENLAQRIDSFLARNNLSSEERTALSKLVAQYAEGARQLSPQ